MTPFFESVVEGVIEGPTSLKPTEKAVEHARKVPLEYRAQAPGRSKRQFIKKARDLPQGWKSPIEQWLDEWVERVDSSTPFTTHGLQILEVQIDWRLISDSGLDEGVIRPVTGAGGWPLIPGSSIKGLFRRACLKHAPDRLIRWCGGMVSTGTENTLQPGLLRFHGAWPVDDKWMKNLLDVVHPQQEWQVGIPAKKRDDAFEKKEDPSKKQQGAFGVVSLYQPKLQIGLSCAAALGRKNQFDDKEWGEIMATLRAALEMGIGGRTCIGYGSSGPAKGDLLFECGLEGQGPAAKLLDDTPEFRPTMFRAAIRGMALRLFGGVTEVRTARQVVGHLFGSIDREDDKDVNVGLLATAYTDASSELGSFGWTKYRQPTYATSGRLQWRLARRCEKGGDEVLLAELLGALHGLTMSLGGFGRGWRRPDHRIFYPGYDKTPIGCHWQWRDAASLPPFIHVQSPADLARLLQTAQRLARRWLDATASSTSGGPAPWREVIHPARMNIWTRKATGPEDAVAVAWFHSAMEADRETGQPTDPCHLKGSDLAGRMNQVGLIWNRLLPLLTPGQVTTPAKAAQPANPLARPVNPTARPVNPMARPPSVARGRPSAGRHPAGQSQGNVSIAAHQGDYLEILVLHALPNNPTPEATQHHQRFIDEMNQGARADFAPLNWR